LLAHDFRAADLLVQGRLAEDQVNVGAVLASEDRLLPGLDRFSRLVPGGLAV
jgi:hypothetical protein